MLFCTVRRMKMKKVLILMMVLLMVGCQADTEALESLQKENETLKSTVSKLTSDKTELMTQIKTSSSEKLTLEEENQNIKGELETLKKEKTALEIDNEALLKNLDTIEFDTYVSQYNFDVKILNKIDNKIQYVLEASEIPHAQNYTIIGFEPSINNISESDNETIDLGDSEFEVTSLKVEGSIFNLKWMTVNWNDAYTEYESGDLIESIGLVSEQRVNINTILPEGLPNEMIQWENSKGEVFEILLSYDGYGLEGTLIISE